jgi:hypothetical protein
VFDIYSSFFCLLCGSDLTYCFGVIPFCVCGGGNDDDVSNYNGTTSSIIFLVSDEMICDRKVSQIN